ncbi:MAG: hypothetical protein HZB50_03650 [Chloroflexi bacterium]|nr:hypothetical protein [Chloroflexota bacterium]
MISSGLSEHIMNKGVDREPGCGLAAFSAADKPIKKTQQHKAEEISHE